ncbi:MULTISPECIES: TetR/AcrR family transcriptional regulator [unclassified Nocardia]|uniref:TetR/AcrR family transcriptional regulator n=1 Tax=unclassified Nocardia TaxID=2637762 RepID=UPI001CE46067|nr:MULTISPECIES: TetR/AcrR family transcriptional regulator [unclassified Nocardia]
MKERRRYDSIRRAAQAQQTSAAIADAARELFVTRGWAATTIREVATAAGVSVPTVYAAYGNKAGLARALVDAADLSADLDRMLGELDSAAGDPAKQLAAMAGYDRRLYERSGDVIVLLREAGRTEPELAHAYREARDRADDAHRQVFAAWPKGTLRQGLDLDTALDIYAALCNIDIYRTFIDERGWTPQRVQRWWAAALPRELLAE